MKRTRDWRRHQKFRMREKAKKILKTWQLFGEQIIEEKAKHMADNMQVCSCSSCCNPRHSGWAKGKDKLTLQERKYTDDYFY